MRGKGLILWTICQEMVLSGSSFTRRLRFETVILISLCNLCPCCSCYMCFILFRLLALIPFKEGRKTTSFCLVLEVMNIRLDNICFICGFSKFASCKYLHFEPLLRMSDQWLIWLVYLFCRALDFWMILGGSMLLWHEQDMALLFWETLKFWANSLYGIVYWLTTR